MMHVDSSEAMHHDAHNEMSGGPGQSGHTGHSSDCCSELENTQCCGEPDAIKKDNLSDHDFQIVAYVTDWLTLKSASSRPIIPTLNFYLIHSSLPRLHLLLGVFLD